MGRYGAHMWISRNCSQYSIQLLPEPVRSHIFKTAKKPSRNKLVEESGKIVSSGNDQSSPAQTMKFPDLPMPKVYGHSIVEHFDIISGRFLTDYVAIIDGFVQDQQCMLEHARPAEWRLTPGWTKYCPATGAAESVEYPDESLLVLDVEVCLTHRHLPTLATALSPSGWYSWCSQALCDQRFDYASAHNPYPFLIPMRNEGLEERPLIVIAHNAGFDRMFVQNEYRLRPSRIRFLDTMAMHQAVSGITNVQMNVLAGTKSPATRSSRQKDMTKIQKDSEIFTDWNWKNVSCKANLLDVYRLYCGGFPLHTGQKEELRNVFVKGTIEDIRADFQLLTNYCSGDVLATTEVAKKLYPLYRKHNPSPVTLAGALIMGNSILPADGLWTHYKSSCEAKSREVVRSLREILVDIVEQVKHAHVNQPSSNFESNIWLHDLDWTAVDLTKKRNIDKIRQVTSCDQVPSWYYKLIDMKSCSLNVSSKMRVIPSLLQLRYKTYPVVHMVKFGWGFLVPSENLTEKSRFCSCFAQCLPYPENRDLTAYKHEKSAQLPDKKLMFFRLPHPSGKASANVGTPITLEYLPLVQSGVLTSDKYQDKLEQIFQSSKSVHFWNSNRERIVEEQIHVIPTDESPGDDSQQGFILPKLCVHGTLSRRATESTWLTAMNAQENVVGGELKAMIRAPDGYSFVGADVDAQEIWIAGLIGDSTVPDPEPGVTPLGWMVVKGDKSSKSDIHSFTAKTLDMDREAAKVINYSRIYGAGLNFVKKFIEQNSNFTQYQAMKKATKLMESTKGKELNVLSLDASRLFKQLLLLDTSPSDEFYKADDSQFTELAQQLNILFKCRIESKTLERSVEVFERQLNSLKLNCDDDLHSETVELDSRTIFSLRDLLHRILTACGFNEASPEMVRRAIVARRRYVGGTESAMFSRLEEIAASPEPRTPFLDSLITRALLPENCGSAELASRINWVVQSSAVDYLHLLLVCVQWLCEECDINMRFSLSIHDEVRYLVAERDQLKACWVLQVANLFTRCSFSARLGMHDLPVSVAFFSAVDMDRVLRKDPANDCRTLSNPRGLLAEHGVPPGRTLTAQQLAHALKPNIESQQ